MELSRQLPHPSLQAAEAHCADLEQKAGREAEAEALLQEASDRIAELQERLDSMQASALADARCVIHTS